MKKVLLVYTPFCTPASPSYSITNLYSFLKNNSNFDLEVLDLNLEFHKLKFPKYQKFFKDKTLWKDYEKVSEEYSKLTKTVYSENNSAVVKGKNPELFDELLQMIIDKKPDFVVFSVVYSSQAFYTFTLLKELKKYITIIGGPAVNEKLNKVATYSLKNEIELLEKLEAKKVDPEKLFFEYTLDFSVNKLDDCFTPNIVIPIKTSSGCYYKRCTFCTHHGNASYFEYPLENIKKTVKSSKQKYFFIIDDMVHLKRLLKLADIFKESNVNWLCQFRPTIELTKEILIKLKESGLGMITWGVESGNDRILELMGKGTNKKDIAKVLKDSHDAGIKNVVYIIFGFPTETKEEFMETIEFLKINEEYIDLISTSIFGLQSGTLIYGNPEKFGITKIIEEKRTILEPKISYEVGFGLTQEEAIKLREKFKKTIEKINKFPKAMNFFREHMFCSL